LPTIRSWVQFPSPAPKFPHILVIGTATAQLGT